MKTHNIARNTKTPDHSSSNLFFNKNENGGFFSKFNEKEQSFFNPAPNINSFSWPTQLPFEHTPNGTDNQASRDENGDAGTPDAGTTPTDAGTAPNDAGTPDAGQTPGSPAVSNSSPATLLRIEVIPEHRRHFPRINGTGTGTHWVGVASLTATPPRVRAVFSPTVSPTDPRVAGLTWSGRDVTPVAGNPLEAEVRRSAGRRVVTAVLGTQSARTTIWAVFARITATAGPTTAFTRTGSSGLAGANSRFSATILPNSILTAADRPRLEGANDTPPPGGNAPTSGNPLSGGADHHWDFSRKSRSKLLNPDGITLGNLVVPGDTGAANIMANSPWGYPAWEVGNDDASTADENNNPYTGTMTSRDRVRLQLSDAGGANGNTFERRIHFQEFVRLEIARRWWVVSHMFRWRVHQRFQKVHGRWQNNGTTAAADNAGF